MAFERKRNKPAQKIPWNPEIGDKKPPAALQNPGNFSEHRGLRLCWQVMSDERTDDHVKMLIGKRKAPPPATAKLMS